MRPLIGRVALLLAVALALPPAARPASGPALTRDFRVPVLMYHRVEPLTPAETRNALLRDLTVLPAQFEEQVRYLATHGFVFVTAGDVAEAVRTHGALPAKAIALTFDDGYSDNHDFALPILRKYHATATVFLVTSTVGTPRHLTWAQVAEMRRSGVAFASHTVRHLELARLPVSAMDRELRESRRTLGVRLGVPVVSIAYPSGSYNATVVERARDAGYTAAWRKEGGPVTPSADPLRLPRVRVSGRLSLRGFAALVERAIGVKSRREHRR